MGGASGALIVEGIEKAAPAVSGLPERVLVLRDQRIGGMVEDVAFHPFDPVMAVAGVDWRDGRIVDPKLSLAAWDKYVPPAGAVVAEPRANLGDRFADRLLLG